MENFRVCFNAVFPAFATMLVGYLTKRSGLITQGMVSSLNRVIFRVFMPVMIFYNLYISDTSTAFRPATLLYCLVGVLLEFIIGIAYAEMFVKDRESRGVMVQGIYRSNFAMIGLPIVSSLVGESELGGIAVLLSVVIPVYNALAVVILSIYGNKKISVKELTLTILKNPLIIGSVIGIFFLVTHIVLPKPIIDTAEDMSAVAGPMLLFLVGAFFRFDGLRDDLGLLIRATVGRLILMPAIFLPPAVCLGFRGADFAGFIGVFAASNAVGSYSMTLEIGGNSKLAGNIVVITSILSPLTVFLWCILFKSAGIF